MPVPLECIYTAIDNWQQYKICVQLPCTVHMCRNETIRCALLLIHKHK